MLDLTYYIILHFIFLITGVFAFKAEIKLPTKAQQCVKLVWSNPQAEPEKY